MMWKLGKLITSVGGRFVDETSHFEFGPQGIHRLRVLDRPLDEMLGFYFGKEYLHARRRTLVTRSFVQDHPGHEKPWTYRFARPEWTDTKRRAKEARERTQKTKFCAPIV